MVAQTYSLQAIYIDYIIRSDYVKPKEKLPCASSEFNLSYLIKDYES